MSVFESIKIVKHTNGIREAIQYTDNHTVREAVRGTIEAIRDASEIRPHMGYDIVAVALDRHNDYLIVLGRAKDGGMVMGHDARVCEASNGAIEIDWYGGYYPSDPRKAIEEYNHLACDRLISRKP